MAKNPRFDQLLRDMREMHDRKNHDYASDSNPYSNFEEAAAFAGCDVETVFMVLIGIKAARLRELKRAGKAPNNESRFDSKFDFAMYAGLMTSYDIRDMSYDDRQLLSGKDANDVSGVALTGP